MSKASFELYCGDALEFISSLADDSIDMLFTSPPYLEARTYGIGAGRKLDDWVAWMAEIVRSASPKVKGLIAINCEGQTRNYRYLPAPFLLMADLHRAGFNLRKPPVFHRVGIPGSGGPDWLRNDWEPIVCVTRPGRLPWSDNTAMGGTPKYAPGGAMSHRLPSGLKKGERFNKRCPQTTGPVQVRCVDRDYLPPDECNPGNVIKCNVGGGQMGHSLAHENEAPMPLKLAEFFVLSFAPPGGRVLDPFCGSGTTIHAAIAHGRVGIGCDIRQGQVDLTRKRLDTVTASLFE